MGDVFRTRYVVDEGVRNISAHKKKDKSRKKWTMFESIWVPRTQYSDARDFYDGPHVRRAAFDHDWAIAASKYSLDKKLEREAKKLTPELAACTTLSDFKEAMAQS